MAGRNGKALTVTLTKQMAARVKARVESGEYASESEVIRDGLRMLEERKSAFVDDVEEWLQTEGKRRAREHAEGRAKTVPADEAFARIRKHMASRAQVREEVKRFLIDLDEKAIGDIERINDYVAAQASEKVANAFVERLMAKISTLATAPYRGTKRDEYGQGCRTFGFEKRATILFRVEADLGRVTILGVFYGGRDIAR